MFRSDTTLRCAGVNITSSRLSGVVQMLLVLVGGQWRLMYDVMSSGIDLCRDRPRLPNTTLRPVLPFLSSSPDCGDEDRQLGPGSKLDHCR